MATNLEAQVTPPTIGQKAELVMKTFGTYHQKDFPWAYATARGSYDNSRFMMLSHFEMIGDSVTKSTRQITHEGKLVYLEERDAVKHNEPGPWQGEFEKLYQSALANQS